MSAVPSATPTSTSSSQPSSTTSTSNLCLQIEGGNIVISKRDLIAAGLCCALVTLFSLLAVAAFLYREYHRRQQLKAARSWGRKSRYENRISVMRKEVDGEYTRQYSGCLTHEGVENPEMGSDSPVELMLEERLHEVAATPAEAETEEARSKRKSRARSLFFDSALGLWMPKR